LRAADSTLINAPEAARSDVIWHLSKYICDTQLKDERVEWSSLQNAMSAYNFDPLPVIFSYKWFNFQRWGGAFGEWQKFARSFIEKGQPDVFARIIWSTLDTWGNRLRIFSRQGIEWPELKAGFEAICEKTPRSVHNLNYFAIYACLAADRETAAELIRRLETAPVHACAGWAGQYEEWKAWALEGAERVTIPTAKGYESL